MGRKCCVTNCNGNYDNDSKEKVFHLPKNKEREKWLKMILRATRRIRKIQLFAKDIGQKVMRLCSVMAS